MNTILSAVVVGIALAGGVLGLFESSVRGGMQESSHRLVGSASPALPGAHSDATTWPGTKVRLNENIIKGKTTTICTEDATLFPVLQAAAKRWNKALDQSFTPLSVLANGSSPPASCTQSVGIDVLLRVATTSDTMCLDAAACYLSDRTSMPPRRHFYKLPRYPDYSVILWRNSATPLSTMVHELGHVLGLGDYADHDDAADTFCDHFHDKLVDPLGDHFSVMAYSGDAPECRSPGVITGRDLRDLYEAYHIGPLTEVRMKGSVGVTPSKRVNATFYWGKAGAQELSHNAKYLLAQRKRGDGWETVGSAKAFMKNGEPQEMIGIIHCDGVARQYRLVGGSAFRMGLNAFVDDDSLAAPVATLVEDPPSSCGTSSDSKESSAGVEVAIGDPTLVVGVAAWNGKADDDDWCAGKEHCPPVLSASMTQSYCFTGAVRPTIAYTPSGGESDSAPNIAITGGHLPPLTLKALPPVPQCHLTEGPASFMVTARWGLKADDPALSLALPVQVLTRPKPVKFEIAPSAAPGACNPGDTVSIGWNLASDSGGPVTVYAHGQSSTTSPFEVTCPVGIAAGSSVEVWALRKDGGGKQVNATATQPLALTGLTTVRDCVAGEVTTTFFHLSGGNSPYMYTDHNNKTYPNVQPGNSKAFGYRCPSTPGVSKLTISVTDGVGRTGSAPFTVKATCSLPLVAPSAPFSQSGAISSDAIRLTWSEVCSESYRVRYAPAGLDGNDVVESDTPSVTIGKLQPNTLYRFTVQALAHGEASQESLPASMMTAPTPPQPDVRFRGWAGDPGGSFGVDVSWPQVPGATTYSDAFDVSPGEVTPARIGTSQAPTCRKGASGVERICENLAPDQMYEFEVRAVNSNGDASEAGTVEFCLGPCEIRVSNVSLNSLRVDWEGLFERASFHEVRIVQDGKVVANIVGQSKGLTIPSSRITTGGALKAETTYRAEVRTWYTLISGWGAWAGVEFTTPAAPKPDPLTLTVTPSGTTCLTSGSVSVSWSVTGGSGKYEVSVDGNKQSGSSATVACQATAGDQSVTVVVTDKTHATLTKTQTITLTVTKPQVEAPTELSVRADVTSLTLAWEGPDGASGYGVRRDGGAETTLPATTLRHPFPGLTPSTKHKLEVRAYIDADHSVWSSIEATTLSPPPLVLTASAEPTSCETNAQVTVSWTVTGGSDSYTVSVDGDDQSGSTSKVTCQATAGTQSVTVKAQDKTYTQLAATQTITLTVTKPAPPTLVTAQIRARRLADNRVEFRLRLADGTEQTTDKRYMKLPEVTAGRWYSSSAFTTSIEGVEYALGVVSVRLDNTVCPAFVAVTFIPAGGERITPTQYKLSVDREADLWAMTSEFAVPLQPSSAVPDSAQSEAGHWMIEAPEGTNDGPGRAGGAMLGDSTDAPDSAQADNTQASCTDQPTGLQTSNITSSGVRLSWQAVSGASQYDVSVGGAEQALASTQRYHDFTGLAADTDHTLRVRARSWRGASEWSGKTIRTTVSSVPVITITSGASPINEGDNASFTVASDRAPTTALTVKLSITESGAMVSGGPPTEATIASGARTASVTVATEDDERDESDSVVTAKLVAGSGYRPGSPSSAAVTVSDDDGQVSELTLTASASPTSCETGGEVTVSWTVTGGSGSHNVTVDGTARSGSSTKLTCQATAGAQTVTVKATDQAHTHLTATETLTLTVTDPVTLTATVSPTSCETGGSGSHAVTVDGKAQTGSSTKVTCQATAGTQTVTVKATDDADSKLTITRTLNLTVTKPPSTVEAQLQARRMSDNRFEIGLRLADGTDVSIKHRFADPTSMTDGDWQHSEVLTTEINDRTYT